MIRAIIFDCFGVVLTDSVRQMCDEAVQKSPEKAKQIIEVVDQASRGILSPAETDIKMAELLGMAKETYVERKAMGEARNEPLLQYIAELRKKYKTAMLSNVSSGGLLRRFRVDELDRYFDVTVASAEIGFAKPEAQAYEITAERLGVRLNECVFIDDRAEYCEGARGVGMKAIVYSSLEQLALELTNLLSVQAAINKPKGEL